MNTQLDGGSHFAKMQSFLNQVKRWRLAYMGVTVHQDGPDLANQGTIVASQAPVQHSLFYPSGFDLGTGVLVARSPVAAWDELDKPNFTNMQTMPNAYFNRSKEGAYIPLKLTKTCQVWHSASDLHYVWDRVTSTVPGQVIFGAVDLPLGITDGVYPHTNLTCCAYDATTTTRNGQVTSPMCNDVFANIAVENASVATSFTFFVRAGFEIEVRPGSIFATHLKLSPPHDAQALQTYFAISREMKDAFPADYNDLGQIWNTISGIAKTVAPVLSAIPGIGTMLSGAVGGVASVGDAVQALMSRASNAMEPKKEGTSKPSQADVDLARMMKRTVLPARVAGVRSATAKRKPRRKKPRAAASTSKSK